MMKPLAQELEDEALERRYKLLSLQKEKDKKEKKEEDKEEELNEDQEEKKEEDKEKELNEDQEEKKEEDKEKELNEDQEEKKEEDKEKELNEDQEEKKEEDKEEELNEDQEEELDEDQEEEDLPSVDVRQRNLLHPVPLDSAPLLMDMPGLRERHKSISSRREETEPQGRVQALTEAFTLALKTQQPDRATKLFEELLGSKFAGPDRIPSESERMKLQSRGRALTETIKLLLTTQQPDRADKLFKKLMRFDRITTAFVMSKHDFVGNCLRSLSSFYSEPHPFIRDDWFLKSREIYFELGLDDGLYRLLLRVVPLQLIRQLRKLDPRPRLLEGLNWLIRWSDSSDAARVSSDLHAMMVTYAHWSQEGGSLRRVVRLATRDVTMQELRSSVQATNPAYSDVDSVTVQTPSSLQDTIARHNDAKSHSGQRGAQINRQSSQVIRAALSAYHLSKLSGLCATLESRSRLGAPQSVAGFTARVIR